MSLPALLVAAASAASALASPPFEVRGTVEHLVAPLGVATLRPRFSWTLLQLGGGSFGGQQRNLSQVGYSLRVGSCSSGDVASAASNLLECAPASGSAAALQPGRAYTWQVIVTLSDGSAATMPPQRFSTGLQGRSDWHPSAEFIGLPPAAPVVAGGAVLCPWLRSASFSIAPGALASGEALLSVASIGWHEVYLNGRRLEDASALIPSVSDLHRRVLSHQYNASAHLHEGENVLAFWAAPGWSQLSWPQGTLWPQGNVTAAPLVMAQLSVCGAAGCDVVAATNASGWKASPSSVQHTGAWKWGNYGGEQLDHRLDVPLWGTTASTTSWAAVSVAAVGQQVTPESLEAMAAVETLPATAVAPCNGKPTGSCFVISFARLFNGFFTAKSIPGLAPGQSATLTYSANCLSPCPAAKPYMPCAPPTTGAGVCTSAATEWHAIDTVVAAAGPGGATTTTRSGFANKFNWHTFQFVVVETNGTLRLTESDLAQFNGQRITNAQTRVGSFTSSSPMLNRVYSAFQQTYEGLTLSGMQVDCTNRERLGYGGDAHSRIEFAMDSYTSHALYSKWLVDWRDTQLIGPPQDHENPHIFGNVPNTAPTYVVSLQFIREPSASLHDS